MFRSQEEAYRSPIELQPCRSPDTWKLFFLSSCVGNEGIHISYFLRIYSGIIVLARGQMVSGTVNQAYSQELSDRLFATSIFPSSDQSRDRR